MHRRVAAFAIAILSITAAIVALSCAAPQQASNTPAEPAMSPVERGRYLTTIAGCNDCHTPGFLYGSPDTARALSGSEIPWGGPWGVVYSGNLTPDPETGLGNWTDDQVKTAIRTGARPDGRQLAPIMPWMNLAHLTNEDLDAIVAYLRSLPPIVHAEPAPTPPGQHKGAMFSAPPPPVWDVRHMAPPSGS
jgi:mono/diheme cytochrome c family protein